MDLADKVIQANEKQEKGCKVDELGLGVVDTPDYIAARALYRNTIELRYDPSAGLLHTRKHGAQLWKGNQELEKSKNTIYRLAAWNHSLKDYELEAVWASLLKNVPELDETKIMVDGHTYWDLEKGELCHTTERIVAV